MSDPRHAIEIGNQIAAIRAVFPCHADRDGECAWGHCPQKKTRLSGCPLFDWDHDEEGLCTLPPVPVLTE